MRHRPALLIAGNDQRRQFGPPADGLQGFDLGRYLGQFAATQVAPGEVDAADQATRSKQLHLLEIGITDDEMPADRLHRFPGVEHRIALGAVLGLAPQRHGQHGEQHPGHAARQAPPPEQSEQRGTDQQPGFPVAQPEQQRVLEVPGVDQQQRRYQPACQPGGDYGRPAEQGGAHACSGSLI